MGAGSTDGALAGLKNTGRCIFKVPQNIWQNPLFFMHTPNKQTFPSKNQGAMMDFESYAAIVPAPFGAVGILIQGEAVFGLDFLPPGSAEKPPTNALAAIAAQQVRQYLAQPDFRFNLPLTDAGTAFQRKVWREIAAVAPGKTTTYGQIAARIDSAPRAIGQACGANPFPLITPCHRVISASGGLGGFAGQRDQTHFLLATKSWLLAHESTLVG